MDESKFFIAFCSILCFRLCGRTWPPPDHNSKTFAIKSHRNIQNLEKSSQKSGSYEERDHLIISIPFARSIDETSQYFGPYILTFKLKMPTLTTSSPSEQELPRAPPLTWQWRILAHFHHRECLATAPSSCMKLNQSFSWLCTPPNATRYSCEDLKNVLTLFLTACYGKWQQKKQMKHE